MQTSVPLPMALMDFLPNLVFLLGAYLLYRCGYRTALFLTGSVLVFLNGMSKALWKLILALGGPDIVWLSQIFVVLLSSGFLLMFIATWQRVHAPALNRARGESRTLPAQRALPVGAALAASGAWKIPFMVLALIGAVGLYTMLILAARRAGRRRAIAAFAVAMLCVIVMSGLSGGDFNLARQWLAQSVNLLAQSAFTLGAYLLYKGQCADPVQVWDMGPGK